CPGDSRDRADCCETCETEAGPDCDRRPLLRDGSAAAYREHCRNDDERQRRHGENGLRERPHSYRGQLPRVCDDGQFRAARARFVSHPPTPSPQTSSPATSARSQTKVPFPASDTAAAAVDRGAEPPE